MKAGLISSPEVVQTQTEQLDKSLDGRTDTVLLGILLNGQSPYKLLQCSHH